MSEERDGAGAGRRERYRVKGEELVAKVKEIIHEGNVRRIIIRNDAGRELIEIPLSLGVAGAILAPVLAAVGAVAALVASCSIEVIREDEEDDAEGDGEGGVGDRG